MALQGILSLLHPTGLDFWRTASVLGYCLLPVIGLAALGILLSLKGLLGLLLSCVVIAWSTFAATRYACSSSSGSSGCSSSTSKLLLYCTYLYPCYCTSVVTLSWCLLCAGTGWWTPSCSWRSCTGWWPTPSCCSTPASSSSPYSRHLLHFCYCTYSTVSYSVEICTTV